MVINTKALINEYIMNLSNPEVLKLNKKFQTQQKHCKSINDWINFSYSFNFDGTTIIPLQKKWEISTLISILQEFNPHNILEIGTSNGGTLFLLTRVAASNSTIISVDLPGGPFGGELYPNWKIYFYNSFRKDSQKIHLLRTNSHNNGTLSQIKKLLANKKFDFILIDGDHSYQGVKQDFEMYSELVNDEGIIAFHDINSGPKENVGGVPKFWHEICKKFPTFEIIDNSSSEGYGIGILINSKQKNSTKYLKCKKLLEKQKSLLLKRDSKSSTISDNPISYLHTLFLARPDLQQIFPEVHQGNFNNLINWAYDVISDKHSTELISQKELQLFKTWLSETHHKLIEKQNLENEIVNQSDKYQQELSQQKDTIADFEQDRTNLRDEIKKQKDTIADFEQDRTNLRDEIKKQKDTIADFEQDRTNLRDEIKKQKDTIADFEQDRTNLRDEIKKQKDTIADFEQEKNSLQDQIAKQKDTIADFEQDRTNLRDEIKKQKDTIADFEQEKNSLQDQIAKQKDTIADFEQDRTNLRDEIKKQKDTIADFEQEKNSLQDQIAKQKDTIADFEQDRTNLRDEIKKQKDTIADFEQEKNSLQDQIAKQKDTIADFEQDRTNLETELNNYKTELNNIKSSKMFKTIRFFGSKIDKINRKQHSVTSISPVVKASVHVIKNEGITSFVNHAGEKIRRREFSVLSSDLCKPISTQPKIVTDQKTNDLDSQRILDKIFSVSVVIPTNSSTSSLQNILTRVASQQGISNIEIILVNSGTEDLTKLSESMEIKVIDIEPEKFNHGTSRELGASNATNDYIIFLTDDALPLNDYLFYDLCNVMSEDNSIGATTARQIPRSDCDLMYAYSLDYFYNFLDLHEDRVTYCDDFDKLSTDEKRKLCQIDDVCSCYQNKIFKKYKYRKIPYAEDLDMGVRLIKDGYKIAQLYSTGVIHSHTRDPTYYLKRQFIEAQTLQDILNVELPNYPKLGIKNFNDLSFHVIQIYYSLTRALNELSEYDDFSDLFSQLNLKLDHYFKEQDSKTDVLYLKEFLSQIESQKLSLPSNDFLLLQFKASIKPFENYLQRTYSSISGIKEEFSHTMYKILASLIGNTLGTYIAYLKSKNPKNNKIDYIENLVGGSI